MGFNLGAGLAAMGKSIADTAGDAAINIQRAELEKERIALADSLAGARESKGRQEAGMINAAAAKEDRDWRTTEAEKREAGEQSRFETREKNETARTAITNSRMLALHDLSERAADGRLDKQLAAAKEQALAIAKNKEDERILESVTSTSKVQVQVPYMSAQGEPATRPEWVVSPALVAEKLRDLKRPDLANPFDPKPVKQAPRADAAPTAPPSLVGTKGLQWNPSLQRFRDADGKMYDKNGKPVK